MINIIDETPFYFQEEESDALDSLSLSNEVTIVTSYVDLGSFAKGEYNNRYTPQLYKEWMKIFAKITNPVIAYFDDSEVERLFLEIRSSQPKERTKTVAFDIQESWAFSLQPRIEAIISLATYPKFHPNTVLSEYGCMMHAKYEMMATTARRNPFLTKYIAWLDIGLFRDLTAKNASNFKLSEPPLFDENKVSYSQVSPFLEASAEEIFKRNYNLVCGCYFIGRMSVILSWTNLYRQYVEYYLNQGLTNTDQQVLYAMAAENKTVSSKMQLYFTKDEKRRWFHLGYLSMKNS